LLPRRKPTGPGRPTGRRRGKTATGRVAALAKHVLERGLSGFRRWGRSTNGDVGREAEAWVQVFLDSGVFKDELEGRPEHDRASWVEDALSSWVGCVARAKLRYGTPVTATLCSQPASTGRVLYFLDIWCEFDPVD
jgi:hypothetical protein